ncbi:MAG: winged helix DNA-binding domain-containing protein [Anaerolineae bacterium]|nr:winged helix DNA-binding domain-containing protein [Anaerolineae bacterium]
MTKPPSRTLSLSAARALALHAQGLTTANGAEPPPTLDALCEMVARLVCVQIDTLHVVRRSQYLVLWSRLGAYDPADFDRLIYDPAHRRLFEYWYHAASIIPLSEYRYRLETMRHYQNGGGWWPQWAGQPENRQVIEEVRARLLAEGALRASDFEHDGPRRDSWWDWKPAKRALEYLYDTGEAMIADRVSFQRIYNLRERVLPGWVDITPPTAEETHRHMLARAVRALGIATAGQIADYAYMKRGDASPALAALRKAGELVEVAVETVGGGVADFLMHRDDLPLAEQAADGAIIPSRTTFLSPFDSLMWGKGRDAQLWGFTHVLEAYKRAPQRIWGYFSLPILHRDRLVGRFDPKLDRKTGRLRLEALHLEPGVAPDDALIGDIAATMRDFMAWHGATDLVIERSAPGGWGERLLAVL